jgi:hypothetical protein
MIYSLSSSKVHSTMIDLSSNRLSSKLNTLIFNILTSVLFFIASSMRATLFSNRTRDYSLDSTSHFCHVRSSRARSFSSSSFWADDNCERMFRFITVVLIDDIHLIFRWWLSDCSRIRFKFEFRDFESRTRDWSITILSLIRINDDSDFFISCCIAEKFFTSRFIVHIS